jgi:hypothetical protein
MSQPLASDFSTAAEYDRAVARGNSRNDDLADLKRQARESVAAAREARKRANALLRETRPALTRQARKDLYVSMLRAIRHCHRRHHEFTTNFTIDGVRTTVRWDGRWHVLSQEEVPER